MNKKVRKCMALLMAALLLPSICLTALAASGLNDAEKSILANLKDGTTVNGQQMSVPVRFINMAETEMMKDGVDFTAVQAAEINAQIDTVLGVIKAEGATQVSRLSDSGEEKIFAAIEKAAGAVDYTVAYNYTSNTITVKNAAGSIVATVSVTGDLAVIKQTGFDISETLAVITLVAAAAAVCLLIGYKKQLFVRK